MRAWLEESKFYMFATNLEPNILSAVYHLGILMLFHCIWTCRGLPCCFSVAVAVLKAELNRAQFLDGVLVCCSCLRGESKGCFQRGFRGVC